VLIELRLCNVVAAMILAVFGPISSLSAQQIIPASLDVIIEELGPDASRCNITREGVSGAIQSALRYNRVNYSAEADAYAYVSVTIISLGGSSCATGLDLSIRQWDTLPDAQGGQISGTFEYCSAGLLLTGGDQANRLYAAAKNSLDQCLAKIRPSMVASFNRQLRQVLNDQKSDPQEK
jgi:hypothetical protein